MNETDGIMIWYDIWNDMNRMNLSCVRLGMLLHCSYCSWDDPIQLQREHFQLSFAGNVAIAVILAVLSSLRCASESEEEEANDICSMVNHLTARPPRW